MPLRKIVSMARAPGIDAIVAAAYGLDPINLTLPDFEADFVGLNLRQWIGAPLGVGLPISRMAVIHIDSHVQTVTVDFAALVSVAAALRFQVAITAPRRAAGAAGAVQPLGRGMRDDRAIEVLSPDDPRMHAGMTAFRMRGQTSTEENRTLAAQLLDRFGIFTVLRSGSNSVACVRVTRALFDSMADVDALAGALRQIAE